MNTLKQTVEKQKRHIERREATAEIAECIGAPVRDVRRLASTMSTARIRQWLAFEQRTTKRISKPVQASAPVQPSISIN